MRIKLSRINFIIGILFFFLIGLATNGAAQIFDAPWRGFDTGTINDVFAPTAIAAGDIDGDGDVDAVVGNRLQSRPGLSILKNLGNGNYASPVLYQLPSDNSIGGVALADFDADGDLDVLATIPGGNSTLAKIFVWRNNGDGTLAARVEFPTGTAPVGIVAADFTGDGFADVVTANSSPNSNNVSLLRHNGQTGAAAAYLAPVNFAVGSDVQQIAAADLNGDGKLDLAVGHLSQVEFEFSTYTVNTNSILLNTGNGSFSAPTAYVGVEPPTAGARSVVALADLNNDGKTDLIGGATRDQSFQTYVGAISVRRGLGDGTFGQPTYYRVPSDKIGSPRYIIAADLNGDGFREIIAATPSGRAGDGYVVLMNDGAGNFPPQAAFYEASQQTYAVIAADADRDGDTDVLTAANSSAAMTVHRNPGNGIFSVPTRYDGFGLTEAIESADIDGDGDVDIVVNDNSTRVFKNNGNGTFAPVVTYTQPRPFADMKLRDLNGDGKVDLLFGPDKEYPPYDFGYALNNGNGTFAAGVIIPVGSCGEGSIDAFDMDGDGDLDVALTEEQACINTVNPRIFIYRNNGGAQFTLATTINSPATAFGLSIANVTGDGKADLVTSFGTGIAVFSGNGNLTFNSPVTSSTRPFKFKLADFNRDGKLDVGMILPQNAFGTLQIGTALGNGNGTFQAVQTRTGASVLETLRIANDIDAADVDGDGRPDLIVTNSVSNDISVFLTNADGSLQPHQRYGAGYSAIYSTVNDFTGDGKPDIAASIGLLTGVVESAIVVLRNVSTNATRRTAFDFDGDGKSDVAVFRPSNGTWYLQNSSTGFTAAAFGLGTDKIVPADYDGDGKTDIAVYRNGTWYLQRSQLGFTGIAFGTADDVPAPADFNGDGKSELAVFRPSSGVWYFYDLANNQTSAFAFGQSGDKPVAADYDGDGKADVAVYRAGTWYLQRSQLGFTGITFGAASDRPVPADYDGDGKTDIAVFRPSNGYWYLQRSQAGFTGLPFGLGTDIPAAADYDGDGKADIAVYRDGTWYLQRSQSGFTGIEFGAASDKPVPSAFVSQ